MSRQELGKGVWYDPEGTGYIMYDLTDQLIPLKPVTIGDQLLLPKTEFHCSLVAARKVSQEELAVEATIVERVQNYLGERSLRFVNLTGDYYHCQKDGESTVIAGVHIEGLDELRVLVREVVPDYEPPFPHVTLLKSENSEYGIGVNSAQALATLCVKLPASSIMEG